MHLDECHDIIWNHLDYEFEECHEVEVGLDEFVESYNGTKRDFIIDAFDWMVKDLADEYADEGSVEHTCYLWVNDLCDS